MTVHPTVLGYHIFIVRNMTGGPWGTSLFTGALLRQTRRLPWPLVRARRIGRPSNPRLHPFHWFLAIACAVAIYLLVVGAVTGSVNGGLLS